MAPINQKPIQGQKSLQAPRFPAPLSEEDASRQAALLRAVAHPVRLRILSLLHQRGGDVYVREIGDNFPLAQPALAHHMRLLRKARLVDCDEKGTCTYYYIRRDTMQRVRAIIDAFL